MNHRTTGTATLGIGSYAYAWNCGVPGYPAPEDPWTAFDLLDTARRLGLSVLQIDDNVALSELSPDEIRQLRGAAEAAGIVLEIGTRGTDPARIREYVDIASRLDARLLRSVFDDTGAEDDPERVRLERATARLRESVPGLASGGIVLALENYERYSSSGLRSVIESLASEYVGVCLDTVNSFGYPEDQHRVIETLAPVTVNLHIKDFRISRLPHKMGFALEGTPAGEGILDIAGAMHAISRYRRTFSCIIETWPPWSGDIEETASRERAWAERSVENMRKLLAAASTRE